MPDGRGKFRDYLELMVISISRICYSDLVRNGVRFDRRLRGEVSDEFNF